MIAESSGETSVLLTDLYQLTMLQGYFDVGMEETAVFEFFVRKLPAQRNFLIAAGLEQVLGFLESTRFTPEDLEWVSRQPAFRPEFVQNLTNWRFNGDVDAMPEGTIFFPRGADTARDGAASASPSRREPAHQPDPFSDSDCFQSRSFGFIGARQG